MSSDIGKVHLVGAGPGDSELLTVKAKRLIENSDVIFHDSLVGDGVLDWIPESAEVHNVGKKPGGERTPQDQINRMMATQATNGKQVVRLKGGDPKFSEEVGKRQSTSPPREWCSRSFPASRAPWRLRVSLAFR